MLLFVSFAFIWYGLIHFYLQCFCFFAQNFFLLLSVVLPSPIPPFTLCWHYRLYAYDCAPESILNLCMLWRKLVLYMVPALNACQRQMLMRLKAYCILLFLDFASILGYEKIIYITNGVTLCIFYGLGNLWMSQRENCFCCELPIVVRK